MHIILGYLLLASSFALASYFFIHVETFKKYKLKNGWKDGLAYIVGAFLMFPLAVSIWVLNKGMFIKKYGESCTANPIS